MVVAAFQTVRVLNVSLLKLPKIRGDDGWKCFRVVKLLLASTIIGGLLGCDNAYPPPIPIPDNIPTEGQVDTQYISGWCILNVHKMDDEFAATVVKNGIVGAFDKVGTRVLEGKPEERPHRVDLGENKAEYWYAAPIVKGVPPNLELADKTLGQLSACVEKEPVLARTFNRAVIEASGAYFSFRDHDELLFVMFPEEKILIAVQSSD
ncbi:hypothetical protein [Candidatus Phyllobacterium onerii]|uniref:hypothetical protein n=1 Tax=Candidatus Phyllobacterium onerii TaxID=3020828 RepID=UPI00232AE5A5|nr:hypothetical protein [Phyllobacterium sp. IY22]